MKDAAKEKWSGEGNKENYMVIYSTDEKMCKLII